MIRGAASPFAPQPFLRLQAMPHSDARVVDTEVATRPSIATAPDSIHALRAVPWLAVLAVTVWVAFIVATSTGQWGDHFEQRVWAHGLQWGYHKHPPLPTWMLAALIAGFGPATWSASLLAWACTLGTGFFTYRIAKILFGHSVAALALLLWGLQHAFSARAALFNHNTVMMLAISITAWAMLRALQKDRRAWLWWLATGAAAGLSILSKYQALVPLAGLLAAALMSGELSPRPARRGLLLAAAVASLIVLPHARWVLDDHFSSLAYATQQGQHMSSPESAFNVASFLAQQVRMLFPSLLLGGLLLALPGPRGTMQPAGSSEVARQRSWLFGLIALPFALTVLTGPLFGMHLQNHWGYQATQFASLWLAWRLRPYTLRAGAAWITAAVLVHAVFISAAAFSSHPQGDGKRHDRHYPAQALSDAVLQDWRDDTLCPLEIVVGPTFEAGLVSVYSGGRAKVLEDGDFTKSPWLSRADLERNGAVYVARELDALPTKGVTTIGFMDVPRISSDADNRVYWAIAPPERCAVTP
jgi:hypothetical protein